MSILVLKKIKWLTIQAPCQALNQSVITNQPPSVINLKSLEPVAAPSMFIIPPYQFDYIDLCPKYWFRECQCCFQTTPTYFLDLAWRFCFVFTCLPLCYPCYVSRSVRKYYKSEKIHEKSLGICNEIPNTNSIKQSIRHAPPKGWKCPVLASYQMWLVLPKIAQKGQKPQ